jgi:carbamoylphosphate synthase small subunit
MKSIYELVSEINKFTKKSFGHKTNNKPIAEVQEDESNIWSRIMDYSEKPHISFDIKEEEIYNDLNEGRE